MSKTIKTIKIRRVHTKDVKNGKVVQHEEEIFDGESIQRCQYRKGFIHKDHVSTA